MKKGKILWLAVIAALVLVPTLAWAQATVSTKAYRPQNRHLWWKSMRVAAGPPRPKTS